MTQNSIEQYNTNSSKVLKSRKYFHLNECAYYSGLCNILKYISTTTQAVQEMETVQETEPEKVRKKKGKFC